MDKIDDAFDSTYCDIYARIGGPDMDWISVKNGLPKKSGMYICTCSDGSPRKLVTFIKFSHRTGEWMLTGARAYWKVRAWMPMPAPWEGEES